MAEAPPQEETQTPRVNPLDPDFLIIILPFAVIVDAVDIVLEVTSFLVVPKLVGIIMDLITWVVIGSWMYLRVGRAPQQRQGVTPLPPGAPGGAAVGPGGAAQSAAQGGAQQAASRGIGKILKRTGFVFLGEAIPFVGIMPFWTITVLSTLREQ